VVKGGEMRPNVIEFRESDGVEINEVVGLCFTKTKGVSLELARKEWELAIRVEFLRQGLTDDQLEPFVTIEFECGGKVVYQKFDDIPIKNVPCSCGNPKHWFVKYMDIESNMEA